VLVVGSWLVLVVVVGGGRWSVFVWSLRCVLSTKTTTQLTENELNHL
jgi:hypothetical protein